MSSSIFSSRHWRELWRIFWLRPLLHACVVLGLMACLGVSWWVLQQFPESSVHARMSMPPEKQLNSATVLIMGNSRMRQVRLDGLSMPAVSLATAGSDFCVQWTLLKTVIDHMPKLRYLVLGMDEISYYMESMHYRFGDYRDLTERDVPWWDLPEVTIPEKLEYACRYQPLLTRFFKGPKLDYAGMTRIHAQKEKQKASAKSAAHPMAKSNPTSGTELTIKARTQPAPPRAGISPGKGYYHVVHYLEYMRDIDNSSRNHEAFRRIVDTCKKRGITLVLVFPPTSRSHRKYYLPLWKQDLDCLAAEAALAMPEQKLILCDWTQWLDFSDEFFQDPSHLNDKGGRAFTKLMNLRLSAHMKGVDLKKALAQASNRPAYYQ